MHHVQKSLMMGLAWQFMYWSVHFISSLTLPSYVKKKPYDRNLWCQFTLSFFKGGMVFCATLLVAVRDGAVVALINSDSYDGPVLGTGMELPLCMYLGYATSDLLCVIAYYDGAKGDASMVVHHVATCLAWIYVLEVDFAHDMACVTCFTEFTTPFLALRWFMSDLGLKKHPVYALNGLVIMVGWYVFRIGIYTILFGIKAVYLWPNLIQRDAPIFFLWCVGAILQVIWAHKLTKGFIQVVRKREHEE